MCVFDLLLSVRFNRNPISIDCLAPYGGPIEPGIAVGGLPKVNKGKTKCIIIVRTLIFSSQFYS